VNSQPLNYLRWLEQIPDKLRYRLVKFGLLETSRIAAQKPLSGHITAFEKSLLAKERTTEYVSETKMQLKRITDLSILSMLSRTI
jgi:hypothetical protein